MSSTMIAPAGDRILVSLRSLTRSSPGSYVILRMVAPRSFWVGAAVDGTGGARHSRCYQVPSR